MGFSADWIERQLAHIEPNAVRRTYNHAEHLAGRSEMMQQWADMLDTWGKSENKITPIKNGSIVGRHSPKATITTTDVGT